MARFGMHRTVGASSIGLLIAVAGAWWGCSDEASTDQPGTSTSTGTGGTSTTSGTGGSGAGGGTSTGSGGSGGSTTTTSSTTSSGGSGGAGGGWPTCDTKPGGTDRTIHQIWQDDPSTETPVWVQGAIVTAVSWGACSQGHSCSIYVQEDETYGSLGAAAQRGIKLLVSAAVAEHFTGLAVGDVLDIYAHALRSTWGGANELLLLVNEQYPGCAADVGDASPQPITGVVLGDLTVNVYEQTHGPLFVQVATVSGTPGPADETFALWHTSQFSDAGIEQVVSLSPYCLTGGQFVGLTQQQTDFSFVQGVFGLFVPFVDGGTATKYKMIYPREMADIQVL